jgi:abortive infection bacteriophage resistance protein
MKYTKPPLSFSEQADLLIKRGLICDRNYLINILKQINYYRLSAYLYPFRVPNADNFQPDTTLDEIKLRYDFDSELRLLIMAAIEYIEVALLRTQLVSQFTLSHGAFCYAERANFNPKPTSPNFHKGLLKTIKRNLSESKHGFIQRYKAKYTSEKYFPFWMVVETMSFTQLVKIVHNLHRSEKRQLAHNYGLNHNIFESWLHTLTYIRNACAHHVRLWNRILPIKPKIPNIKSHPNFHIPVLIDNERIFSALTIMQYFIHIIDPNSGWNTKVFDLIQSYPDVPVINAGFPNNWQDCPIWG